MKIELDQEYIYARSGQQYGPFDGERMLQLAKNRQLLDSDHVWTTGMDEWVPAADIPQLARIFEVVSVPPTPPNPTPPSPLPTEAQTVSAPEPEPEPEIEEEVENLEPEPEPEVEEKPKPEPEEEEEPAPPRETATAKRVSPTIRVETRKREESFRAESAADAPTQVVRLADEVKKRPGANFLLAAFTYLLFFAGLGSVFAIALSPLLLSEQQIGEDLNPEDLPVIGYLVENPYIGYAILGLLLFGGLWNGLITLVYLRRAWKYIQDVPNVTTTPFRAVFLLFIPLFNVYWIFVAFRRWAEDFNLRCDLADPVGARRVREGLFSAHCVFTILGFPILYLPMMFQMCRAINYLSKSPELEIDPNAGYHL